MEDGSVVGSRCPRYAVSLSISSHDTDIAQSSDVVAYRETPWCTHSSGHDYLMLARAASVTPMYHNIAIESCQSSNLEISFDWYTNEKLCVL